MDLETENRPAALLMEEARRLRAQAEKEGVGVYLRQPNVRGHLNSRFLTAIVLGLEQVNRAVEVNDMWCAREKEWELDAKLKTRAKDKDVLYGDENRGDPRKNVSSSRHEDESCRRSAYVSSSKHGRGDDTCYSSDDGGLRDDEVEEFLRSRTLTDNMVVGVSKGFAKRLQLVGVGYRAMLEVRDLVLNLGFSHPVRMAIPNGLQLKVEENTRFVVSGYDKCSIGEFAAAIRKWRPPGPYKGKGVRYADEVVRRKEGEAGKKK